MTAQNKTASGVDMSAYWLPFTPNRYFQHHPKIMQSAKGAYYFDDQGRKLFDGLSGLWCSPLGHADPRIGQKNRLLRSSLFQQAVLPISLRAA
jgi:beta-alanine--pyruvate transaminase